MGVQMGYLIGLPVFATSFATTRSPYNTQHTHMRGAVVELQHNFPLSPLT